MDHSNSFEEGLIWSDIMQYLKGRNQLLWEGVPLPFHAKKTVSRAEMFYADWLLARKFDGYIENGSTTNMSEGWKAPPINWSFSMQY